MSDLFARTGVSFGGAMASDRGLLVPNKGLTGFLMQNLQLTYSQQVTRVYEIGQFGSPVNCYYIGGRSAGTLNVGHIVGPRLSMAEFYRTFSDVCQAADNDIKLVVQAQCDGPASAQVSFNCKFCVLVQVGLAIGAQDFVIGENSSLMFSNCEYGESGGAPDLGGAQGAGDLGGSSGPFGTGVIPGAGISNVAGNIGGLGAGDLPGFGNLA